MTSSVGRRLLIKLCERRFSTLPQRIVAARFTTFEEDVKPVQNAIPALQPGNNHDEKMSAAVLREFSKPLVIEKLESPKRLQNNEVLIDVEYCALNTSDILLSKNLHTYEPKLPMILGYEVVGKLIEIDTEAEKNGYKIGDRIIALNKDRYGGLAEKCVAYVDNIWKVPSMSRPVDAVCVLDNYITALAALREKVNINENDMVLINVGLNGIGLAAVDIAANIFGAKVMGVCATENGGDLARQKGAFVAATYKDRRLLKKIQEVAAECDIKVIFDNADGEYFKKVLNCFIDVYKDTTLKELLRDDNFGVVIYHFCRKGRMILIGSAITMTNACLEVQKDSFSVTGFNLMEYRKKKPEVYRQAGDEVLQFLEGDYIIPSYSLIAGLYKINDALQFITTSKSSGKVIIDLKDKEAKMKEMKR